MMVLVRMLMWGAGCEWGCRMGVGGAGMGAGENDGGDVGCGWPQALSPPRNGARERLQARSR